MSEHKRSGPPPEQLVVMITFLGILGLMAGVALLNNGGPAGKPAGTTTPPSSSSSTSVSGSDFGPRCVPVTFAPPPAAPSKKAGPPRVQFGKARTVRIVQANMWFRMSGGQFASDLARVVSSRPDFVTLNEAYRRSAGEITPEGYQSFRAEGPFDARETPVLWREDLWKVAESGTYLMHGVGGKWGIRYTNWVVLEARKGGQTVSIISVHASPGGPGARLRGAYIGALGRLIAPLRSRGTVLIAGDFNIDYRSSGPRAALTDGLRAFNAVSTFETLGEPEGGWATDHGGGTIDYVFVAGGTLDATPAKAVAHSVQGLRYSDHRMVTADVRLPAVRRLVLAKPAKVRPPGPRRPVVTTSCAP